MALKDLVINPEMDALRYASQALGEARLVFADIAAGNFDAKKIRQTALKAKGRAISAKLTVDDAIKAALP